MDSPPPTGTAATQSRVDMRSVDPRSGQPLGPDRGLLWLRRGDRLFVGGLTGVGLLLLTLHWIRLSDWGRQPLEIDHLPQAEYQYEIDINNATWVEWAQFDGVGETLARRIVADRETRGEFESVDDLLRVRGVGPRKLAEMRPHLRVQYASRPVVPANREPSGVATDEEPPESAAGDFDRESGEVP